MPAEAIPVVSIVVLGFVVFMAVLAWQQWQSGAARDDDRS